MAQVLDGQPVMDVRVLPFMHEERFFFEIHDRRSNAVQVIMAGVSYESFEYRLLRFLKKKKTKELVLWRELGLMDVSQGRQSITDECMKHLENALESKFHWPKPDWES